MGKLEDPSTPSEDNTTHLQHDSWVCCDACGQWRRVSHAYAETLVDDSPWYCENNPDPAFASCDVPAEIADDQQGDSPSGAAEPTVSGYEDHWKLRPSIWHHVTENIYTHRKRKQQDDDDVMICQCPHKYFTDTEPGCGPTCINRMLNTECSPDHCPSGRLCQNQQFSRKEYAALDLLRAGAKGYGLFAKEAIRAGQFIIEYVGEVLEEEEYQKRKDFYLASGTRHYYFMNIGNGEVIDACRKGALGRFINHSCDPNCETQKWIVRGELAIGLFALRDIAVGEELTFDYNFERYGDQPYRCLCGSSNCRGVIGGNPEAGPETVAEPEPASQDVFPIMLPADQPLEPLVDAILEFKVGNVPHWYQEMESALVSLCKAHGVDYPTAGMQAQAFAAAPADLAESVASKPVVGKAAKERPRKSAAANGRAVPAGEDWVPPAVKEEAGEGEQEGAGAAPAERKQKSKGSSKAAPAPLPPPSAATLERLARPPPQIVVPVGAARKRLKRADSTPSVSKRVVAPVRVARPMPKVVVRAARRPAVKRRTEVDRQLEILLPGGRFGEPSQNVLVRVLRLFNLCEIGGRRDGSRDGGGGEGRVSARQRARMTDLSLLLDVVLKAPIAVKRDFVRLGLQRQLLSVIGRNTSDAFAVILRKVLRCCEALPLTSEDVHGTRSAHGSLGDTLRELTQHTDGEVRKRAYGLLKAHPVVACQSVGQPSSTGEGRALPDMGTAPPLFARAPPSPPSAPPPSPPLDAVIMVGVSSPRGQCVTYPVVRCSIYTYCGYNTHTLRDPQRPLVMDHVLGPTPRIYQPAQLRTTPSPDRGVDRPDRSDRPARSSPPPRRVSGWGPPKDSPRPSGWDAPTRYQPRGVALCSMRSLFEEGLAGQLVASLGCDRLALEQPPPPPPADDHAAHYGTVLAPPSADDETLVRSATTVQPASTATEGVWDAPDAGFESFVAELVKRRLGKYCQPDHPTRITQADAHALYSKIKGQVVAKERDAYAQRQATGAVKPILRDRVEAKVRDFVRESIKRHLAAR